MVTGNFARRPRSKRSFLRTAKRSSSIPGTSTGKAGTTGPSLTSEIEVNTGRLRSLLSTETHLQFVLN